MKTLFILIMALIFAGNSNTRVPGKCLPQKDAEKILGQSARLTEHSFENKNGIKKSKCTYTALSNDPETSKPINLYFLFEEYPTASASQQAYSYIVSQNRNKQGLKKVVGIGDEAFVHTDNENFILFMSRKGNKMLRLKVNKLTNSTSFDEIKTAATGLIETL